jgi:hypothetical protein
MSGVWKNILTMIIDRRVGFLYFLSREIIPYSRETAILKDIVPKKVCLDYSA